MSTRPVTLVVAPILAAAAVCLVLLALSWPTLVARPHRVPVAITGQPQLVQQTEAAITAKSPDAIELVPVSNRSAAISSIRERDAVGAIILDPARPEVLTASAAGSGGQQVMSQLSDALQQQLLRQRPSSRAAAPRLAVTDVVPLSQDDPTGNRLAIAGLPLALGGVLGGVLLSTALTGVTRRLVGLAGYAVAAGLGLAAILGPWYDALPGSYLASAAAIALIVVGVAAVVIGLRRVFGLAGLPVAAMIFILGSVPISGITVPREFLPEPWSEIGQWFPLGAGSTLLRNLSYFPDAPTLGDWLVPTIWTGIGIALMLLPLPRALPSPAAGTATSRPAEAPIS